jgi:Na+/proline symporter
MKGMRLLCLLFVLLSYIFATMQIAIIVSIMSFSWGIVSGSFIGPYLWGLYWKKTTRAGAWAGMLGGFFTVVIATIINAAASDFAAASANAPIFGVAAMAVSLAVTPLVSLFTPPTAQSITDTAWKGIDNNI